MAMKQISVLSLLIVMTFGSTIFAQTDEQLKVIPDWLHFTDIENSLYHHLSGQALDELEHRKAEVRALETEAQWDTYREKTRGKLRDIIGPFPAKTPLNTRITGIIERPDFTVEKIIYESQPGFHVTAVLLLPKNLEEPAPAVIYTSGHTSNGFRAEAYQRKMINLVKKGFAVLAFDPVGQGERLQYFDEESGQSVIGGPTNEHSYPGAQMFLTGSSLARYMIWDGIRSIDFLRTRNEVDPDRIGITGRSGGGTQSSYIAAMDDRIAASAPENYITSLKYLLKSIGPQDAEQNFYHGIATGIDHADLILTHAPKPAIIIATTRDFFSIQGARETCAEVKRFYEISGKTDHFSMVEDDHGHGSTPSNRKAMYAFFQKHLNNPGSNEDLQVEIFSDKELQVTETGQVVTSFEGETLFTLHARHTGGLIDQLEENRQNPYSHSKRVTQQASVLSGYREPNEQSPAVFTGRYVRENHDVEKYYIQGEGDYPVPYLMFRPHNPNNRWIVYLHPDGKEAEAGGELFRLAEQGYSIVAPDLPGTGELGNGSLRGDSFIGQVSYNKFFAAVQTGRSITGLRAGDTNRLIAAVLSKEEVSADDITIMAGSTMTPVAIHSAAFNQNISSIILMEPLISFESIVMNKEYHPEWVHSMVPGILKAYDLPDLAAALAPRRLLIINPVNQNSEMVSNAEYLNQYEIVRSTFQYHNASKNLGIETIDRTKIDDRVMEWILNDD